ncbi:MAG: ABC transporter ATP-binding protein, partial [Marinomonas sp.]
GTYKILSFLFNGQMMKARLSEDQKVPSGQIFVSFPEQWTKVYENEYLVEASTPMATSATQEVEDAN